MLIRNVTLEVSLKPFGAEPHEAAADVCRRMFEQWMPLSHHADQVSVLIWASDGSEILDYAGDLDAAFEWAKYIGGANPREPVPGDLDGKCLHSRAYLYRDDPPEFTYRQLKEIVEALKSVGSVVTGKPIRVGATFDPGPEFAISDFKYSRHNEICLGHTMGRTSFAACYGVLHGDTRRYAGFPDGIPEGTPFGRFFGRQSQHFLSDLGFDYLWLSNGFGFGTETWGITGAIFDGESFHTERCTDVRRRILEFWAIFREECPDFPIETRGTNLSTGMDLASDAVPLREICSGTFNLVPPVNSPWAALNGDFGLELAGWMSHIAELPGEGFPFRFYTHDPWWLNSPWLDRYRRQPHDIYLPLSVSRINEQGEVETPNSVAFLTVDDSYGRMPDQVPNEVIPHILKGLADRPDALGPVVWLYPFDEYHRLTFEHPERIGEVFFGDWFIRAAINAGFPLNTVVSTRAFSSVLESKPGVFVGSVLVTTAPERDTEVSRALKAFLLRGGKVLVYGPLDHADPEWLDLIGVRLDEPLSGDFELRTAGDLDRVSEPGSRTLRHLAEWSAGGLRCVPDGAEVLASAVRDGDERVAASYRQDPAWHGGALAWVRGTLSCDPSRLKGHCIVPCPASEAYRGERLMRLALARLGVEITFTHDSPEQALPLTCIARRGNGFVFSGYVPEQLVDITMRMPAGAPLLQNVQARIEAGRATYRMPRAWHHDCRVFIEQASGRVICADEPSIMVGVTWRYRITGLRDATVRFFPPTGRAESVRMQLNSQYPHMESPSIEYLRRDDALGLYLEASRITGDLLISW